MKALYNENDPAAAAWLRWLIAQGHVAPGVVDERSIADLQPEDLHGYDQVHLFAGIGGWSLACRMAGWPDDRPLWTASCPCQPFSVAGRRGGTDDERHLWPHVLRLARACRPARLVGEQVAGTAGYGWFDGVRADLAAEGYACRGVDIPACAVDAPHIRQRLYWVALADAAAKPAPAGNRAESARPATQEPQRCDGGGVVNLPCVGRGEGRAEPELRGGRRTAADADAPGALGHGVGAGLEGQRGHGDGGGRPFAARPAPAPARRNGSWWAGAEWIACHDGKARRTQPGLRLLAHGVRARVAAWRGFGNAIVPPLAAEVIGALMDGQREIAEGGE